MKKLCNVFILLLVSSSPSWAGELKDLLKMEGVDHEISSNSRNLIENDIPRHGISKIGLERSGTNSDSSYVVTIFDDGTIHYAKLGGRVDKHGVIPKTNFLFLQEFIIRINYFNLDTYYAVNATHLNANITMVERNGERKFVLNYGDAAPVEIWVLEQMLDHVLSTAKWNN